MIKTQIVFLIFLILLLGVLTTVCLGQQPAAEDCLANDTVALQKEIVAKLASTMEIRPGVKIADRCVIENRKEVRAYLVDVFKRIGYEPKQQIYSAEGANIYSMLTCGRPNAETIVCGAHYDSMLYSPGANDNASGVAVVVAVAQRICTLKNRNKDIIFVFFDEEERGLKGSQAFAKMLKDEKRLIHSVHTIDQMGWDQDGDRAIELEKPYKGALDIYQEAMSELQMNIMIHITPEEGADHSVFRKAGYKAVGITEEYRNKDTTPFIHRPGDTFATIDFNYLDSTTRLIVKVFEMLLNR